MTETTHAGSRPRTNRVEPNDDKHDVTRCPCGREADGVDARDCLATCTRCAQLQTDGSATDELVYRSLRRAAELRREAQQLEIAALGITRGELA